MPTLKSSIKIPTYPQQSESFNGRLGGFFRECWQRMRVMDAEFEHGELGSARSHEQGEGQTPRRPSPGRPRYLAQQRRSLSRTIRPLPIE